MREMPDVVARSNGEVEEGEDVPVHGQRIVRDLKSRVRVVVGVGGSLLVKICPRVRLARGLLRRIAARATAVRGKATNVSSFSIRQSFGGK